VIVLFHINLSVSFGKNDEIQYQFFQLIFIG